MENKNQKIGNDEASSQETEMQKGTKYQTNDGWDLNEITPLKMFVAAYDNIYNSIYELKNCRRTMSLVEMRDELLEQVLEMKEALEEIDDDDVVEEAN